eukprot:TRINITY_DN20065_c0_g2_i1.p2 TRINITY_DN20065_c0_g2~~TRINITY_DN20065_c0_g2_i1.p2  ORF type:complete len:113 (-),score=24.40 TRINITY_DN20065_c0_g2_i1:170-475(-)
MFSYGSGLCSAIFQLKLDFSNDQIDEKFSLVGICENLRLFEKLSDRKEKNPQEFNEILSVRFGSNFIGREFSGNGVEEGAYFLQSIDNNGKRSYKVVKDEQ